MTLSRDVISGAPAVRMTVAPLSLMTLLSLSPHLHPPSCVRSLWAPSPKACQVLESPAFPSSGRPNSETALKFPLPAPPQVGSGRKLTRVGAALYYKGEPKAGRGIGILGRRAWSQDAQRLERKPWGGGWVLQCPAL